MLHIKRHQCKAKSNDFFNRIIVDQFCDVKYRFQLHTSIVNIYKQLLKTHNLRQKYWPFHQDQKNEKEEARGKGGGNKGIGKGNDWREGEGGGEKGEFKGEEVEEGGVKKVGEGRGGGKGGQRAGVEKKEVEVEVVKEQKKEDVLEEKVEEELEMQWLRCISR